MHSEIESNNDLYSTDTGCGSSLAFSDNEAKSFGSPDYNSNSSPLSIDSGLVKSFSKYVSTATSPITFLENSEVTTVTMIDKTTLTESEPLKLYKHIGVGTSPMTFMETNSENTRITLIDKYTSTESRFLKPLVKHVGTSPIEFPERDHERRNALINKSTSTEDVYINSPSKEIGVSTSPREILEVNQCKCMDYQFLKLSPKQVTKATSPVKFLETENNLNNDSNINSDINSTVNKKRNNSFSALHEGSPNTNDEDSNDYEVNNILDKMSMKLSLITPIPSSPSLHHETPISIEHNVADNTEKIENLMQQNKSLLEQIKSLQSSVALISNNIIEIKDKVNINNQELTSDKSSSSSNLIDEDIVTDNTESVKENLSQNNESIVVSDGLNLLNRSSIVEFDQDVENISKCINLSKIKNSLIFEDTNTFDSLESNNDECSQLFDDTQYKHNEVNNILDDKPKSVDCENKTYQKQKRGRIVKKTSKIEKLKNKLLPRSKIRGISPAPRKSRLRKNIKITLLNRDKLKKNDNDKDVYERALQVVTEFREKQKGKTGRQFKSRLSIQPKRSFERTKNISTMQRLSLIPSAVDTETKIDNGKDCKSTTLDDSTGNQINVNSNSPKTSDENVSKEIKLSKNISPKKNLVEANANNVYQSKSIKNIVNSPILARTSTRQHATRLSKSLNQTSIEMKSGNESALLNNIDIYNKRTLRSNSLSPNKKQSLSPEPKRKCNRSLDNKNDSPKTKKGFENQPVYNIKNTDNNQGNCTKISNLINHTNQPCIKNYDDLNIFENDTPVSNVENVDLNSIPSKTMNNSEVGFFCHMLEKHGVRETFKKTSKSLNGMCNNYLTNNHFVFHEILTMIRKYVFYLLLFLCLQKIK